MFGLTKENEYTPKESFHIVVEPNSPVLVQGIQEIDTLCPEDPLTGHRQDLITCLKYALTDQNKGLLDRVLAELPTVKQMDVPDSVKLDTLVSVLDIQSQTDRDIVAKELLSIGQVLFDKGQIDDPSAVKSDLIDFSNTDSPQDANV